MIYSSSEIGRPLEPEGLNAFKLVKINAWYVTAGKWCVPSVKLQTQKCLKECIMVRTMMVSDIGSIMGNRGSVSSFCNCMLVLLKINMYIVDYVLNTTWRKTSLV